jgi:hypothetical protein
MEKTVIWCTDISPYNFTPPRFSIDHSGRCTYVPGVNHKYRESDKINTPISQQDSLIRFFVFTLNTRYIPVPGKVVQGAVNDRRGVIQG